ncbi:hypothetical protein VOLCADRAFT_64058 [Volvox carteri f. nagariensis]|uniref:ABC transporter domain-containing protein n=1 Tax=Volvox carteri f. nagariensis TaxID=3068 RepID=D8U509_VOLCA|nr:uncharacterized protein VOLCADRAFT_64058 [Volvox carteri f. nagariensis]EFJ45135.1 hypothetical protein VOLCADRAFT_64058 [Volvox carteri f. nagariensis]|eukprot:XP_002953811.1 hypothetical protein VOLCADRAFT_64058 [Volvox carteri f. nagariensis]
MSFPKLALQLKLDFSVILGPLFYTWVVQMLLPSLLQQLVYEKEKRLRMIMKMHGLGDGAYWLVTYLWYLMVYIVYMVFFVVFGTLIRLKVFTTTPFSIQAVLFFIFGNNMLAFVFMISSFFSSSRTATVVAVLYIFASGLIGELLLRSLMQQDKSYMLVVQLVPGFALYRGLFEFSEYSTRAVFATFPGLKWSNLRDPGNGMLSVWVSLLAEWPLFIALGWYFEQAAGSVDTLTYACAPAESSSDDCGSGAANGGGGVAIGLKIQAYDVAAEADRVAAMDEQQLLNTPIVVRGLAKTFSNARAGLGRDAGAGWLAGCCGGRQRGRVAVRSLTLAIERGECFGLLGPNGAGKTTTINMLTGFLEPSAGDALVEGRSIRTRMTDIYRMMGVCPQENLLWEQLTGEEHLMFYGRIKGLTGKELTAAVEAAIKSVKLHVNNAGKRRVGAYSGGMKRRLSVAISFMGNPQVVYLDEPSTGLDPASRRALWDVVREHKAGRAIILTTHSMEEAEILCDRLGIFVDGQLVCIGNPREITSRYADYLVFTITVGPGHEDAVRALVARMSPSARVTYSLGGTFKYELPAEEVSFSAVFREVAAAKAEMQVLDWGVTNATLEEVFIKFARQIGVETRDQ